MTASAGRDVEPKSGVWCPSSPSAFVSGWLGTLAVAYLLVSTMRWWTLRRLDAELVWSFAPVPPWPGILGVALVLMVVLWLLAMLPRHRMLVGVVVIGVLLAGLLLSAAAGAAQALQCRPGKAVLATSMVTGLGLNCVRFLYRQDVASTNLPTGRVVWVEETEGTRWVLDPVTGILHGIGTDAIVAWETMSAPR